MVKALAPDKPSKKLFAINFYSATRDGKPPIISKHVFLTEFVNMHNLQQSDIQIVSQDGELWLYYWAEKRLYAPGEIKEDSE